MSNATPYYDMVPKDVDANLRFRQSVLEYGGSGEAAARELAMMCSRDILFYINTFLWLFEARDDQRPVIPFVTFEVQDEVLLAIDEAIGKHDLCMDKSRDEGATYMCMAALLRRWHFREMFAGGCVSRTEDDVDKPGDPKSLYWRLDFFLEHMPKWLLPQYKRTQMRLENLENGSTIIGASTTGNMFRGGRLAAMLIDEYAAFDAGTDYKALYSTQAVTPCRLFNSTVQGTGNAYYEVREMPSIKKVILDWKRDPRKNVGLYTSLGGKLELIDEAYWLDDPERAGAYKFVLDGKTRSPWYDDECARTPIPQLIAQEIDRDAQASGFQFFGKEATDTHERLYARVPMQEGSLEYDPETCQPLEFRDEVDGLLKLWCNLTAHGTPSRDRTYVVGADVSAGTGASNSCLTVFDTQTGEQVAEFTTPHMEPDDLAEMASAVGWWFCDSGGAPAMIIGESNGGLDQQFHKRLIYLSYPGLFYRRDERKVGAVVSDIPGWASSAGNKVELLKEFSRALRTSECILHSPSCIEELREYVWFPDQTVGHARSRNRIDPSGARTNHGDQVMAAALAWRVAHGQIAATEKTPEIRPGCLAYRIQKREQAAERATYW